MITTPELAKMNLTVFQLHKRLAAGGTPAASGREDSG